MLGIIGKKVGMTSIFDGNGKQLPCTVIQAGPCVVTQVKTQDKEGYNSIQLGFDDKKEKKSTKAVINHCKKNANTSPKNKFFEFRDFEMEKKPGDIVAVDIFEEGEYVNIIGKSKGKGFQGVVKRHGFKGVGMQTHGQHNRLRAPGSSGASSFPSRVLKGMRRAGRMGNDRVKMQNLQVLKIMKNENVLLVKGAVPGHKGSYVVIEK